LLESRPLGTSVSRIENYRNTHFRERELSQGKRVVFVRGNVVESRPATRGCSATLMTKGCHVPKLVAEHHLKVI
jgi:hypothetical protein